VKQFPDSAKFKFPWRSYQQRVLDDLDHHLEDNHLHVIAPPGSGKTILGLEVARRLNKPTLIFAPSISIRNQWADKFKQFFLDTDEDIDWISTSIKDPKFLTVTTYQSLFAAFADKREDEPENAIAEEEEDEHDEDEIIKSLKDKRGSEIIAKLREQGIQTIVVDEAHHLQNAWWKCLIKVKEELAPTIIGLTATPPYDSSATEWNRYSTLNGPVDAEISVPELVVEGDLCPHQDYIYFSVPTEKELAQMDEIRAKIMALKEELSTSNEVLDLIESLPPYQFPHDHLEWIYDNTEEFSSLLIFLNHNDIAVSNDHMEVLGNLGMQLPKLEDKWLTLALQTVANYEYVEGYEGIQLRQEKLSNRIQRTGAVYRGKIDFVSQERIDKQLTSSLSKLSSINSIVKYEHETFGANLHMVILSDYIRKEYVVSSPDNTMSINKLGVIPIFESLRRNQTREIKLGVLTGSLIILHKEALQKLEVKARENGFDRISAKPLPYDQDYYVINVNTKLRQKIVLLVTELFEEGNIEVMIGTKSLLGEGWDAPSINSLVLASFVGSYVLSNQMRGRAIRAQRTNPKKTGNIWHLVCVDENAPTKGADFNTLDRRFLAFVGVSISDDPYISNGIDRIAPAWRDITSENIAHYNADMLAHAGKRDEIISRWEQALNSGNQMIEAMEIPLESFYEVHSILDPTLHDSRGSGAGEEKTYAEIREFYWDKTIAYLYAELAGFGAFIFVMYLQILPNTIIQDFRHFITASIFILIILLIIFGGQLFRYWYMYVKYRDINKDIQNIGETLLESLYMEELVKTPKSATKVVTEVYDWGLITCSLDGATAYEQSLFNSSLYEIVDVIRNPRYIIVRKSKRAGIIPQKDFHSVPDALGRKKKVAQQFRNLWNYKVGDCDLIYTRTIEGRKFLIEVRGKSLAATFSDDIKTRSRWQ